MLPWILPFFVQEEVIPFEPFEVDTITTSVDSSSRNQPTTELFLFDPNTLSKDSFMLLGLSEKTAQTILRYRTKVGAFKTAADLKKIYTLKPQDFQRLAPYINIPRKSASKTTSNDFPQKKPTIELVNFNPNTADKETLRSLGLSNKVCSTLLNFRKKGGKFYEKEDLKLIYGLTTDDYQRVAPYIQFNQPANRQDSSKLIAAKPVKKQEFKRENIQIDLNQATAEEWQQLYGIGPGYARRITNFREKLGGFTSIDQVSMTYGLPDSTFQEIKTHLNPSPIFRWIPINTVSAEELKNHPLIKWKEANIIINYRSQHGAFSDKEDLLKIKGISEEKMKQLLPYFSFD